MKVHNRRPGEGNGIFGNQFGRAMTLPNAFKNLS